MNLEQFIQQYGYFAVFIGTCLEGEGVLVLAGFFAHRGYLSLPIVLLLAFSGSFFGDQLCFTIGHLKGRWILDRRPKWQPRAQWILSHVATHERWLLLAFRFVPGTRLLTPLVLGLAGYPHRRFALYNVIGAAVWALSIGLLGYFAGHAASQLLQQVKDHEIKVVCTIIAIGIVVWAIRRAWLNRKAGQIAPASTPDRGAPSAD